MADLGRLALALALSGAPGDQFGAPLLLTTHGLGDCDGQRQCVVIGLCDGVF